MKKIIIALAIAGFTWISAEAQTAPLISCGAPKGKVCRKSGNNVSCYKTPYAEDFKICKGDNGYFVCCETPGNTNATHPPLPIAESFSSDSYEGYMNESIVLQSSTGGDEMEYANTAAASVVPQSQSYPPYSNTACAGGCYARKSHIRTCYGGNNVAELNRAAYRGCPTPAYDGPEANRARNINSNNTVDKLAPINGRPE